MARHRYQLHHGMRSPYVIYDGDAKRVLSRFESKSAAIAEAQRLNGFAVVDGDENTYGQQIQHEDDRP